ncbi:MAG: hypothetical protein IPF92_25870 [Myxococcales bacterium]|nr:hypothetical protein [Myxococcales bacterium]
MARSSARSRGSVGALLVTLALGSAVACSTTTDPEGAAVTDAGVQGERGPEVLATCTDGAKNGSETDVDCWGSCPKCVTGKACGSATDCVTASCTAGVCAAQPTSCRDGTKNASETDVDCGGACPKCANGKACGGATDCASGTCARGVCGVLPPSCAPTVRRTAPRRT